MADTNTLLPKPVLVAKCRPFEAFDPAAFLLLPFERICEAARFGPFRHQHRVHTNHQAIARLSKRWDRQR